MAVTLWLKRCFAYFWLQENTRLKNRKEEKELRRTNRNIIVKKLGKDKNLQIFNIVVMIFKWYQYCRVTERSSLGWSFDSKDLATEYFGIVLVIPYRAQCLVSNSDLKLTKRDLVINVLSRFWRFACCVPRKFDGYRNLFYWEFLPTNFTQLNLAWLSLLKLWPSCRL